jgi:hypothetical protein
MMAAWTILANRRRKTPIFTNPTFESGGGNPPPPILLTQN